MTYPPGHPLRLLLIEDLAADADLITYELRKANIPFQSTCVASKRAFLSHLRGGAVPDAIISDFSLGQFNALDALQLLRAGRIEVPFILVTGTQSEEVAVQCIKEGADDYILKSSLKRLPAALLGALHKRRAERGREDAEEALRRGEEYFRSLLDKASDAILVLDLEGAITFWNRGAERLYGWSAPEIIGAKKAGLFRPEETPKLREAREAALQRGEWHGEFAQLSRDGRELTVESRWSLIKDHAGHPKSILLINSDVTEKKKLEAHFLRAQRMESIGTLAGGIAHDLNNVFTPIIMSLKFLRDLKTAPAELLETLETSAHRGASIVQQVLSFARGAEGERTLLEVKHPLNEVIRIARDVFPPNIQLRPRIAPGLWPVMGDPTQLHQVFMNLFVNAKDAMPSGGRLQVEAANAVIDENYARMQPDARAGRYVVLSVSDSGTGIPPGVIPKIFEPFFTTKDIGKGTGLGLSTALAIVRGHGGFLTVYSEPGRGTCFKVHLPAAETAALDEPPPEQSPLPPGRGQAILVVDDEAAVREIIKLTLEANGYKILTASDGTEAVASFATKKSAISAIIVDVMMPYMDGPSTIRAIQKLDPSMRFIAISGLMDNAKTAELSGLEGITFLPKPFTTEQLLTTLHETLRERSKAPAA